MLDLVAAFIALTTLLTYVNYRFIRLPPTIGVMATALVFSLIVQGLSELGYPILEVEMQEIIRRIDFSEVLMTWFLPALLFAGALHVDLSDLRSYKWPIGLLATAGVLIATFVIGGLAYYTFPLFGWQVDFIYCLLFGALISPTDPIAVLGILKSAGAPKPLATTIVGESLFNDGTAVVVFAIILGILQLGEAPTVSATAILFVQEAIGGVVFGAVLGYGVFVMMRGIDQYQVEVMLTLALVIGGAALAARLHVSAPIAMVVAGLIIGNHGRHYAMSDETRRYVDKFWELIDEILNALLFALIGLEAAAVAVLLAARGGGLRPRRRGAGLAPAHGGPGDPGPAPFPWRQPAGTGGHHPHPGLGWAARRRLGGAGAVPAVGAGARPDPQPDLHRGAGIDPAPGAFHRPAGASYLRRPAAGEKRGGALSAAFAKRAPAVMAGVFVGGHQALSCGASLRWVPRRFIAARQTCSRISA